MSHRLLRGIVMPFTTALAAVVAALGVLGPLPALGATASAAGTPVRSQDVRSQEWWLTGLHVTQAWRTSVGTGITVAVLGTGVDLSAVDLAGDVITGPDFTGSGRTPGNPFWGFEGTAVAAIIAGHGHGAGDRSGIIGIAPAARIISVRVTLEFNDPLSSDASISRRLPQAIADGITYAVAHGARIIDLPLDPGTLGLAGRGEPVAAGGSPAERAAVNYALGQGVVLVAPAGDDGMGPGLVNYPAAYPGVIAVGAVNRGGRLASFSSRRSYVSLTAPGVGLEAPDLAVGYQMTSSTSAASGMVAGVAALIMSRFPHLTAAQVTQALTESTADVTGATALPPLPARSTPGTGYGTVDAARAMQMASLITAASQPHPVQSVRPRKPARRPVAAPRRPGAGALAGSVLRAALAGVGALIVLLVVTLLVTRSRRKRSRTPTAGPGRARARGLHEQRKPDRAPAPPGIGQANGARSLPQAARPEPPAADRWPSPGGWQGGGIGAIAPEPLSADPSFRPAVTSAPRGAAGSRSGRDASAGGQSGGPPWAPAPEPGRTLGPLPVAAPGPPPPEPGPGIRVPGDMAVPPAAVSEPPTQRPLGGLDTPTPPAGFAMTPPLSDFGPPDALNFGPPAGLGLRPPTAPNFSLPPVTSDYGPPTDPGFSLPPVPPDFGPPTNPGFSLPPVPSDYGPPTDPGFSLPPVTSDFGPPTNPGFSLPPVPSDFGPPAAPDFTMPPAAPEFPAREHLGFAAAPVADDYVAPFPAEPTAKEAQPGPPADPSFIWDLAATDVFPAVTGGDPQTESGPPTETADGPELPS